MRSNRIGYIALALALAGCSSGTKEAKQAEPVKKKISRAPDTFQARFTTTKGEFIVETTRDWAPHGADRFYELVSEGFYDGARFYRVRPKFIVQWGINKDPKINELWRELKIPDDPVKQKNRRGTITFAKKGPASRTTQVFINLKDNSQLLDKDGFAPFGRVAEGMDVVDKLYSQYGEVQSLGGGGPDPAKYETIGEEYIRRTYAFLDQIQSAKILP